MSRLINSQRKATRLINQENDLDKVVDKAITGAVSVFKLAGWCMANPGKAAIISTVLSISLFAGLCLLVKSIFF